jgi:hypothetical protein
MYGKHFASMYTGSMFGKKAVVFAVWGYVISNLRPNRMDRACYVELNPALLASTFSDTEASIMEAIEVLCAPDPASRTQVEDGRRLIRMDDSPIVGPSQYRVVNGPKYRAIRDEEERRSYLREAKRRSRSSSGQQCQQCQPPSTQVEVEVEEEVKRLNGYSKQSSTPSQEKPAVRRTSTEPI